MRCVRSVARPARGSMAVAISSMTMLRRNTISNEPMWRCSSRTAIAIMAKQSTAPSIHSAPRSSWGFTHFSLCYLRRTMGTEEAYRRQIAALFERSPFYREKLAAAGFVSPQRAGGIADIAKLPFTEKDELRASQAAHPPLGSHAAIEMRQAAR